MLLDIRHETTLNYASPVNYSIQQLRLTPREDSTQRPLNWKVQAPGNARRSVDAHGNVGHLLTLDRPHSELSIVVSGTVRLADGDTWMPRDAGTLSPLSYLAGTRLTEADEPATTLAAAHLRARRDTVGELLDLSGAVCGAVRHQPDRLPPYGAASALASGMGCGADIVHAFIACCRAVGLPARYVSGYLIDPAGEWAAPHAWVDVWLASGPAQGGEAGWVSVDVIERSLAGHGYCRLAVGRDYLDACPVRVAGGDTVSRTVTHVSIHAH
ncbi:transglutaminase family protein [Methyloversatilis thermotolerans]|uniref:transglutaminase family protein n=1 Tax=Methyloversatilis thermotolerans TaxID=1346290 RepID=UPI00037A7697|nr:transglutaminase family protein [Methyloversatilis thermotolerans]